MVQTGEKKLQALDKKYELKEQEVLNNKNKIDRVFEQRQEGLSVVRKRESLLLETLNSLRSIARRTALLKGESWRLGSLSNFEAKIRGELRRLGPVIAEKKKEVDKAFERLSLAEKDLIGVRIERKKLEKVRDRQESLDRLRAVAQEELQTEEMSSAKKRV